MGFARIFWKNNVHEAYLQKMSISGQIFSEIVAQLCLENSIQTLVNFFGVESRSQVWNEYRKWSIIIFLSIPFSEISYVFMDRECCALDKFKKKFFTN